MDSEKKQKTIEVRQEKEKRLLLEQLKRIPIIQFACEKAGVGRATYYRWREEDETFRAEAESAIAEGEAFVSDMSESQLISLIKDKNWAAISFWLRHHHPTYANRLQIVARAKESEELTSEQEQILERALKLSLFN